jgi:hypothetical protein
VPIPAAAWDRHSGSSSVTFKLPAERGCGSEGTHFACWLSWNRSCCRIASFRFFLSHFGSLFASNKNSVDTFVFSGHICSCEAGFSYISVNIVEQWGQLVLLNSFTDSYFRLQLSGCKRQELWGVMEVTIIHYPLNHYRFGGKFDIHDCPILQLHRC